MARNGSQCTPSRSRPARHGINVEWGPLGRSSEIRQPHNRVGLPCAVVGTADINGTRIHAQDDAAIKEVDFVTIMASEDADVVMVDVI